MNDNQSIFLIDTNILIYAYAEKDENKKYMASKILEKCWNGEVEYAISLQNLGEFFNIGHHKYKMEIKLAQTVLANIIEFSGFVKINYSDKTLINSIDLIQEYALSFWNSLIISAMKENGIFNIYTENLKDFKVPWINAVNPFKRVK